MPAELFRSNKTSLTDDQLLILDVLIDGGAKPSMLRQRYFSEQWNARPHSLSDDELKTTIRQWLHEGILEAKSDSDMRYVAMTSLGGELWEAERCPIWERYCYDRYPAEIRGRSIMSVRCVTPEIRDDFLKLAVENPVRTKTATISDNGLIRWRQFDKLHVGLASFTEDEPVAMTTQDEVNEWVSRRLSNIERVESGRSWWRSVRELQKFVA